MSPDARRGALLAVAWAAAATGACSADRDSGVIVADSAGVRLTVNPDRPLTYGTVEPEPVVSIGGPDADGHEQFSQTQGVLIDARDRIWVADGQSAELRIFESDGSHFETRGGPGDGPGEFRRIRLLGAFGGDSVAVGDRSSNRISVFDPDGELVRTDLLASGPDAFLLPHRVFPDGTILAQVPRVAAIGSVEPGQILADTARLVRVVPGSASSEIAEVRGPLWLWTGQTQIAIPFTANPGLAVVGSAVHVVAGPAFRVRVFESDRLVESYGMDRPARRVGQDDIDGYRAMTEQYVDDRRRPEFLATLDHEARPDVLPGYARLEVDDLGNVWAQQFSPDTIWDVFAPDRRYLGQVRVPAGFFLEDVRGLSLAGVWRDELTVEHVRVYRLRLTGSQDDR